MTWQKYNDPKQPNKRVYAKYIYLKSIHPIHLFSKDLPQLLEAWPNKFFVQNAVFLIDDKKYIHIYFTHTQPISTSFFTVYTHQTNDTIQFLYTPLTSQNDRKTLMHALHRKAQEKLAQHYLYSNPKQIVSHVDTHVQKYFQKLTKNAASPEKELLFDFRRWSEQNTLLTIEKEVKQITKTSSLIPGNTKKQKTTKK